MYVYVYVCTYLYLSLYIYIYIYNIYIYIYIKVFIYLPRERGGGAHTKVGPSGWQPICVHHSHPPAPRRRAAAPSLEGVAVYRTLMRQRGRGPMNPAR